MKFLLLILFVSLIGCGEVYAAALRTGSHDSGSVIFTAIVIIIVSIVKIFIEK